MEGAQIGYLYHEVWLVPIPHLPFLPAILNLSIYNTGNKCTGINC
jgi:hypothetical protein